mmetsp:Transcript_23299/g.48727  ORF Transcript_23299/g.48727 Transcript_23299/m.48727 type:complete len:208 (+) Transcript_23299:663-1286(+)
MTAPLQRPYAPLGIVRQRRPYKVHRLVGRLRSEDLAPLTRLDLGEFELGVVGVHGGYFLAGGRAEDLDDFDELVYARVTGEEGLAKEKLGTDAALRPNINRRRIIRTPKDQLGRPIIPTANVTDIRLPPHQRLGTSEVAQLQLLILGIHEKVLRLDVAVANPQVVNVGESTGELVEVELDVEEGEGHFGFLVVAGDGVNGFGDVFED